MKSGFRVQGSASNNPFPPPLDISFSDCRGSGFFFVFNSEEVFLADVILTNRRGLSSFFGCCRHIFLTPPFGPPSVLPCLKSEPKRRQLPGQLFAQNGTRLALSQSTYSHHSVEIPRRKRLPSNSFGFFYPPCSPLLHLPLRSQSHRLLPFRIAAVTVRITPAHLISTKVVFGFEFCGSFLFLFPRECVLATAADLITRRITTEFFPLCFLRPPCENRPSCDSRDSFRLRQQIEQMPFSPTGKAQYVAFFAGKPLASCWVSVLLFPLPAPPFFAPPQVLLSSSML